MNAPPVPAKVRRSGPRFLGRYEVIGELARGGMGTVYLARHAGEAGFQRLFAIKVLHAHLAEEAGFVDMLRDEARIAARIHHPNVVAVVDIGTQGESHYIVMEYVEGPSFATLWKRSRDNRPLDLIVSVMIDTLEGLHAAHTLTDEDGQPLHLVHRDVSPQNVLVGVDGVARITDFGIAKAESRIASTMPGTRKGKLQFMSPEQIRDPEKIDHRTDVWAAGVVLYSLLTGEHLFRGENDAATVHNVIGKEVPTPSARGEKPPEVFDAIIAKALDRDVSKRFSSALEMADSLRKAAVEAGFLGSRQGVAKWVTATFAEELESRRGAIRETTRRRTGPSELRDYSQVTVLPSLPSSIDHQIPESSHTPTGNTGNFEGRDGSARDGAVDASLGALEATAIPETNKRRTRAAAGIAAGALLFGIAGFLFRVSARPATPEPAEHAPLAAASPSPSSVAPPASVSVAPPALPPETAAPAEPSAKSSDDKKGSRLRRVPVRPYVAHTEAAPKEPSTAAMPEPAAPRPTAAPQAEFEKNPYLRH
jgi:serine/threonine protein kinase